LARRITNVITSILIGLGTTLIFLGSVLIPFAFVVYLSNYVGKWLIIFTMVLPFVLVLLYYLGEETRKKH